MENIYLLLLALLALFFIYKSQHIEEKEHFTKECSQTAINQSVLDYQMNPLNKGAR